MENQPQSIIPVLIDTSPMPFGKHKGTPMQDIPVTYLHWVWHSCSDSVSIPIISTINYIRDNLNALKMENKDLIWTK